MQIYRSYPTNSCNYIVQQSNSASNNTSFDIAKIKMLHNILLEKILNKNIYYFFLIKV